MSCVTCRKKPFLRHASDGTIGHSGGNEGHVVETDRDPVPTCKVFVRIIVEVFVALNRVY